MKQKNSFVKLFFKVCEHFDIFPVITYKEGDHFRRNFCENAVF